MSPQRSFDGVTGRPHGDLSIIDYGWELQAMVETQNKELVQKVLVVIPKLFAGIWNVTDRFSTLIEVDIASWSSEVLANEMIGTV